MKFSVEAISHTDRCFLTKNRTALIWPFINVPKGVGPYELFLDTNAFSKISWIDELPKEIRNQATFNPWPALMEQWLSNTELRLDPAKWIESALVPLAVKGVRFRAEFAEEQANLLINNNIQLKTHWRLLFPYVAIMKTMVQKKIAPANVLAELEPRSEDLAAEVEIADHPVRASRRMFMCVLSNIRRFSTRQESVFSFNLL